MSQLPRLAVSSTSRLAARILLLFSLISLLTWTTVELAAQAPEKKEEVEDPKPGIKKRIVVDDEPTTPAPSKKVRDPAEPAKPEMPEDAQGFDLLTAAREAKHPVIRDVLTTLAKPHDVVVLKDSLLRVMPVEEYLGNPPNFRGRVELLWYRDRDWNLNDKPWAIRKETIRGIRYYEDEVLQVVGELLAGERTRTHKLSRPELLRLAEQVLSAALRFNESAREQNKRRGDEFLAAHERLRSRLLGVETERLGYLAGAGNWEEALTEAKRLTETYTTSSDRDRITEPLAALLKRALDDAQKDPDALKDLQVKLEQLEGQFPDSRATRPIQDTLRKEAEKLYSRAKLLAADKDSKEKRDQALELMQQAERLWPRLEGLYAARLELDSRHPKLRIGVRELPKYLSPNLAFTDSEKAACELLFEGLVKLTSVPGQGQRYQPCLAESCPSLLPLGRQFQITRNAFWSNDRPVTFTDVSHTLALMRNPKWFGYTPVWDELIESADPGSDPARVKVLLRQGYVDPLSLMTFKVLPAEPWPGENLTPEDDRRFAEKPVSSGPYQYQGVRQPKSGERYSAFVASPSYGTRPGKNNLPRIRELQMVVTKEAVKDLLANKIDVVLDLPTDQIRPATTTGRARVVTGPTRRIYFLAINHRRKPLQNQVLRHAIAHAIPREAVLDKFFRAENKGFHRALNGPYPPDSWACDPNLKFNPATAAARRAALEKEGIKDAKFTLEYPDIEEFDPNLRRALEYLVQEVENTVGVKLELEAKPLHELRENVELNHSYDLAYYWYDYPSEAYWLWPLLHTKAMDRGQGNYMGFVDTKGQPNLEALFKQAMMHRDFSQVQGLTHSLHAVLFDRLPFIPLWQLDRHVALGTHVKTGEIDPLLVLTDVEHWSLDRR